jgi:hypothetical protein
MIRNNAARFESIRSNGDPRNLDTPVYIDRFYLEPHADLNGTDWIVYYNQIVTIPVTPEDVAILLAKKVLQLDDLTRVNFQKFQIGYLFHNPKFVQRTKTE